MGRVFWLEGTAKPKAVKWDSAWRKGWRDKVSSVAGVREGSKEGLRLVGSLCGQEDFGFYCR